jgi:hypothetical protein
MSKRGERCQKFSEDGWSVLLITLQGKRAALREDEKSAAMRCNGWRDI